MNLHEFQAKQLLARGGVAVPAGEVCTDPHQAKSAAERVLAAGYQKIVVKSQIHAGGRGKGTFKNGLKGGVQLCTTVAEVGERASKMLGQILVTRQTGPDGKQVNQVLVEGALQIHRELYVAVLLDRSAGRPMVMACPSGGMDIEEVAAKTPELIFREYVDPAVGLMPYQARRLALGLGLEGDLLNPAARLLAGVYRAWWESDASMVEINPLAVVTQLDGKPGLMAVDGKVSIDDNALYRHPDIAGMRDLAEESPLEVEAGKFNLNYIKLTGNIACLVNGAGLAMATMDIVKHFGGEPANFLDVGGGASQEQVAAAFKIILGDPSVKAILVNIFGGIMRCDIIAQGIVASVKENQVNLPIVVRLEGTNADLGRRIIEESGLTVIGADTLSDAARKAVKAAA